VAAPRVIRRSGGFGSPWHELAEWLGHTACFEA
jgi:hypothetical protein